MVGRVGRQGGLTGPLIKSIEQGGPVLAKIAAGKTFKGAGAEKATEGRSGAS